MASTSEGPARSPYSPVSAKVKVIGVGNAGTRIAEALARIPEAGWLDVAAVDTDGAVLSAFVPQRFLVGEEWTQGKGCGGQALKGERAMAHKSNACLKDYMDGASLLLFIGGFGGGTATGGASVLARLAREKKTSAIFAVTTPFSFEAASKREKAENAIASLVKATDVVVPIPNDLLYSSLPASAPAEQAFARANEEVALAVLGVAEVLRCDNLIPVDFIDLYSVLGKRKTECGVGVGAATAEQAGPDRCRAALDQLLKSPVLGGLKGLKEADALVVTLTGGPDLNIGEMKRSLEAVAALANPKAEIIVGANTDPLYKSKVQITVMSIRYDLASDVSAPRERDLFSKKSPAAEKAARISQAAEMGQPELPFELVSRGIFTNAIRSSYKGEDLDLPTYQRRGVHIDKGRK